MKTWACWVSGSAIGVCAFVLGVAVADEAAEISDSERLYRELIEPALETLP